MTKRNQSKKGKITYIKKNSEETLSKADMALMCILGTPLYSGDTLLNLYSGVFWGHLTKLNGRLEIRCF